MMKQNRLSLYNGLSYFFFIIFTNWDQALGMEDQIGQRPPALRRVASDPLAIQRKKEVLTNSAGFKPHSPPLRKPSSPRSKISQSELLIKKSSDLVMSPPRGQGFLPPASEQVGKESDTTVASPLFETLADLSKLDENDFPTDEQVLPHHRERSFSDPGAKPSRRKRTHSVIARRPPPLSPTSNPIKKGNIQE